MGISHYQELTPECKEARITCAIVDAAAKVRDLNFKDMAEGKGATVTARFGPDGITICDPNRAGEGADKVFQKIYEKALSAAPRPRRPGFSPPTYTSSTSTAPPKPSRPGRTMARRSLCNHAQAVL